MKVLIAEDDPISDGVAAWDAFVAHATEVVTKTG